MICIPLKFKNQKELAKALPQAEKLGDLVEIWFDEIKNPIYPKISKPIIYKSSGNPVLIQKILKFKPAYMDLDLKTKPQIFKMVKKNSPKTRLIISFHDFKKTPDLKTLQRIISKMLQLGADIVKIAVKANKFSDNFVIFELLRSLQKKKVSAICLAMGRLGLLTRLAGHLFGNYLVYAPLQLKDKTADGQIPAAKLRKLIKICP